MQKDQLFTDMAHLAYAGYVPKAELDRIAGKPSWEPNDSAVHSDEVWPEQGPLTLDNDLAPLDEMERMLYIRDMLK